MDSRCHETGDVGHVHQEIGPHRIGDLREPGEVDDPGVGAPSGDDHLRPVFQSDPFGLVIVDPARLPVHAVAEGPEELSGDVHRRSVGKVPPVPEVHAEDDVTGFEHGHEHGEVRVHPGMGLDVGVLRSEEAFGPFDGEAFHHVDEPAAAVVPLSGVAFGVLVGEHRSLGFEDHAFGVLVGEHRSLGFEDHLRDEVFRRDELDGEVLPCLFPLNRLREFRVDER